MAAPALWQFSVAGDLIIVLCAVPLLWIEYLLRHGLPLSAARLARLTTVTPRASSSRPLQV
jgi:hypothetical protein